MSARRLTAAVGLVAIAAHLRTLWFGFTELDDRDLVVDDQGFLAHPANLLHAFGRSYMHAVDPGHAYYRPLVTLSYAIDAQWSGARPFGYHLTNVALHAIACVLFLAVLRRFAMPGPVAVLAALVFAVHPALAEAVAWIPGRNDSLLAVSALAAWIFFLRDRARASRIDRALHFVFFGLALLTKETAVALPIVWAAQAVLLGAGSPEREARSWRGEVPSLVYLGGWTALCGALVLAHGGLEGAGVSAWVLLRNAPRLMASLGKVVFPFGPTVMSVPADLSPWPGGIAALGLAAGARFVPGVRAPVVVFGLIAFVALLVPVLAVPGTLVLDNRLYLPACGVILAMAEIARAAAFERATPVEPRLFVALSGVAVLVLALVTSGYEESFRDRRAFAREAVAGSPHSPLAHFCLGQSYQLDGDADRALAEYALSLSLGPGEVVHNNIAVLYMARARWADAERELRDELALDPRYARAYENLAIVLRHEGRDGEATAAAAMARGLASE
jgi:protein O-mannosyl-transferase